MILEPRLRHMMEYALGVSGQYENHVAVVTVSSEFVPELVREVRELKALQKTLLESEQVFSDFQQENQSTWDRIRGDARAEIAAALQKQSEELFAKAERASSANQADGLNDYACEVAGLAVRVRDGEFGPCDPLPGHKLRQRAADLTACLNDLVDGWERLEAQHPNPVTADAAAAVRNGIARARRLAKEVYG